MSEDTKSGFMGIVKDGLDYIAQIVLANISPSITEGAERVMQNIDDRVIRIEERVIRKIFSFIIIGLGTIFLTFALFFFQREFLGWSNSAAYFCIGILMFAVGLILNAVETERQSKR